MSNSRRGSALLTVLWLTAALAAIGLAVASNVRSESERTATSVDDTKAAFEARGAIDRAALRILWSQSYAVMEGQAQFWRFGVPFMELSFPGAEVHVDVIPETAKLNINFLRTEDAARLLLALGLPEQQALETAAALVDWKTPRVDGKQSPFDVFYLSRTPSFLPAHASYITSEEMLLVKGVTPDLYYGNTLPPGPRHAGLRDCLSVFAGQGVDVNSAEPAVLRTLGIAPQDVEAIVAARRVRPVVEMSQLQAISQAVGLAGSALRYGGYSMYTLKATARLRQPDGRLSDMRRTSAALVKFDWPTNKKGYVTNYEVIRWYDRY